MDQVKKEKKVLNFNEIKGGAIPKEFIPSVEKGFKKLCKMVLWLGYEVENLESRRLYRWFFHPVDSDHYLSKQQLNKRLKQQCKSCNQYSRAYHEVGSG
jgi:elongation factor G